MLIDEIKQEIKSIKDMAIMMLQEWS